MAEEEVSGGQPTLSFIDQHSQGHVSAAWLVADSNLAALTAGADGRLVLQQIKPNQKLRDVKATQSPVSVLSVNPAGTMAAMADGTYMKVYDAPTVWPVVGRGFLSIQPHRNAYSAYCLHQCYADDHFGTQATSPTCTVNVLANLGQPW